MGSFLIQKLFEVKLSQQRSVFDYQNQFAKKKKRKKFESVMHQEFLRSKAQR